MINQYSTELIENIFQHIEKHTKYWVGELKPASILPGKTNKVGESMMASILPGKTNEGELKPALNLPGKTFEVGESKTASILPGKNKIRCNQLKFTIITSMTV